MVEEPPEILAGSLLRITFLRFFSGRRSIAITTVGCTHPCEEHIRTDDAEKKCEGPSQNFDRRCPRAPGRLDSVR